MNPLPANTFEPTPEPITPGQCAHCRSPVHGGDIYCCRGCELAHQIISGAGLEDFYKLRGKVSAGPPQVPAFERAGERNWLEDTDSKVRESTSWAHISVGVSGLYCAACVWLIERTIKSHEGVGQVVLNPTRGIAELTVDASFDLISVATELEQLGYRLVPPRSGNSDSDDNGLLARTGIAIAIALNSMMLAAAIYFGLESGWLHQLFVGLSAALAIGSLLVGGTYFGRRALAVIRLGGVSLDVPIALGIVLVFLSSFWAALSGRSGAIYFDTLSVFVALMLAGRLLQERLLRRNRQRVMAADRAIEIGTKVIRDGVPQSIAATELKFGDEILVAPGEVVPADIAVLDERAGCRLDWMTGESEPRLFRQGEVIGAGATNASRLAFRGRVVRPFAQTALPDLLTTPPEASPELASATSSRVATLYLTAVLLASAFGFVLWLALTGSVPRGFEVAAAVLVVTCPCALGIGAPLAFELIAGRLARGGAFIRTAKALPNLAKVRQIAFDKTGTVTERGLVLAVPTVFDSLSPHQRHVLFNLAVRSAHPRSQVIANAIDGRFDNAIAVTEETGCGVSAKVDGCHYGLGREDWAIRQSSSNQSRDTTIVFAVDGHVLARPELVEVLRTDAKAELAVLTTEGYKLALVSGDQKRRVESIGKALAIDESRVIGGASPVDKTSWIDNNDHGDLLFVGDGLNDAPALERATVSATPSFESPLVAGRVDLYFNGRGLRPIRLALHAAHLLQRIHRAQLRFVIIYNALAVSVALMGWMQPWVAALLMPASSLIVTSSTAYAVRKGMP